MPEFQYCRRPETRSTELNWHAVIKQRKRSGKITRRQRKCVLFHLHRTTNCKATIEWEYAEVQYCFSLVAGGNTVTGGWFFYLNLATSLGLPYLAFWIDETVVSVTRSPNGLIISFWTSGEEYDKQSGFPETESKRSLITGSNFSEYFNSDRNVLGLELLRSDLRWLWKGKLCWARI
jgi:hypothetical protein